MQWIFPTDYESLARLLAPHRLGVLVMQCEEADVIQAVVGDSAWAQGMQAVRDRARRCSRSTDWVAEPGSESVVILLVGPHQEDRSAVTQRWTQEWAKHPITLKSPDGKLVMPLRMQLGWAWSSDGSGWQTLIQTALQHVS